MELKKWDLLKCNYQWWWWTVYYHWDYKIISIWKTIKLELVKWHNKSWIDDKLTINKKLYKTRIKDWKKQYAQCRNWISNYIKNWFIVYCNKQGIPFIFTKIINI